MSTAWMKATALATSVTSESRVDWEDERRRPGPPPKLCPICSETRGLAEHLMEVGLAADYLGNTSSYVSAHGTATIRTETIGDWLRLPSRRHCGCRCVPHMGAWLQGLFWLGRPYEGNGPYAMSHI